MFVKKLAAILAFNALMLGLAIWQNWSVLVILFAYAIESLLYSAFLIPFEQRAMEKGKRRVPLDVFAFVFINVSLVFFLSFSAYDLDAPPEPILIAIGATFAIFMMQYAQIEPKKIENEPTRADVWARAIPALLATVLLSSFLDAPSAEFGAFIIIAFYFVKTFFEASALLLDAAIGKLRLGEEGKAAKK